MEVPNKVEERSHRVGVKNQAIASGLAATAKKLAETPPVRERGKGDKVEESYSMRVYVGERYVKNRAIAIGLAATAKKLAEMPPVRERGERDQVEGSYSVRVYLGEGDVKNQAITSGLAATAKKWAETPPVRDGEAGKGGRQGMM